ERLAGYIQDAFETRDSQDLARQLRLLDMRVRDVLKKLGNDEQALIGVAERAKTSDRQIPLAQRYAEVLATWDEYVEPMIQLVSADGAFEQGVRRVEQVLLRLLGEQQRLGHLVDDDLVLRTHARILEMPPNAQLTLRRARDLWLPQREEARRHNAVTRGAALARRDQGVDCRRGRQWLGGEGPAAAGWGGRGGAGGGGGGGAGGGGGGVGGGGWGGAGGGWGGGWGGGGGCVAELGLGRRAWPGWWGGGG
ncbi:hypothetical protein, partial [Escherichia coli]